MSMYKIKFESLMRKGRKEIIYQDKQLIITREDFEKIKENFVDKNCCGVVVFLGEKIK